MKAAVLTEFNKPFEILELRQDGPKSGEVRVKVDATGVCMSDWHVWAGEWPGFLPEILGHEAAGTVEEVGPDVTTLRRGDRVIFTFLPHCGDCPSCTTGRAVLCSGRSHVPGYRQLDNTSRLWLNGEEVNQLGRLGTFAEYVVTPAEQVIKIREDMPAGPAALIGCSVATGVGAVTRHAQVEPGASVVVVGCGGVGLNIVQGARLAGAAQIIAVDLLDNKLEMAKGFGATHTLNAKTCPNLVEAVQDILKDRGADYAFDGIGSAVTAQQVINLVKPGGHAVLVGIPAMSVQAQFSPFMMVFQEKKLTGSLYGSVRASVDFPILCALYLQGRLDLDGLISQRTTLDNINQCFADLRAGSVARSIIEFT